MNTPESDIWLCATALTESYVTGDFEAAEVLLAGVDSVAFWRRVACALAAQKACEDRDRLGVEGALASLSGDRRLTVQRFLAASGDAAPEGGAP